MNFNTGYIEEDKLVMRRKKICWRYFRHFYFSEIFLAFPSVMLLKLCGVDPFYHQYLILIKIMRCVKLKFLERIIKHKILNDLALLFFELSTLMLTTAMLAHWVACYFYWSAI
jgi:hypothetical protein